MDRASVISVLEDTKRMCEKCLALLTEDDASYYTFKERNEALDMALAALREQEQSNEPLTLEELRNMSGEPVYCADYGLWGIVNIGNCGQWKGKPFIGGYSSNNVSFNYDIEMRGLTLYRHKPKEGADHERVE